MRFQTGILFVAFLLLTSSTLIADDRIHADQGEKPVYIHAVYFWLHDDVTDTQQEEFVKLLKGFNKISSVKKVYVGVPARTPRKVVDNTYDVSLIVQLKDKAGHDHYQADEIHQAAIRTFEGWIKDIKIYDMVTMEGEEMQY